MDFIKKVICLFYGRSAHRHSQPKEMHFSSPPCIPPSEKAVLSDGLAFNSVSNFFVQRSIAMLYFNIELKSQILVIDLIDKVGSSCRACLDQFIVTRKLISGVTMQFLHERFFPKKF
jgi:hypothetical protein